MKDNTNLKVLETLYVGIDVSKNSNQTCILNFNGDMLANFSSNNNIDGAKEIEDTLISSEDLCVIFVTHNVRNEILPKVTTYAI